ncbi:MAG: hypothetical protein AB8B53_04655 [Flavobacteriales bacterium]
MKVFVIICLGLFSTINILGQQKYIEVEVVDTIKINPDQYIYGITVFKESEEQFNNEESSNLLSTEEIEILVERYGLELVNKESSGLRQDFYSIPTTFYAVKSNSLADLDKLESELKEYINVKGELIDMVTINTADLERKLKLKLINKAESKAIGTALLVNRELGELISLSETELKDETSIGGYSSWTVYPPLSALGSSLKGGGSILRQKTYAMKMTFKFELK